MEISKDENSMKALKLLVACAPLTGVPIVIDAQEEYPLVRVKEATHGCQNWKQYDDWLACLRDGVEFDQGDILLLIRKGTFEEGAIVQRQKDGKGYGPRYWTPPQWLQTVSSEDPAPSRSTVEWNELQIGKAYRLKRDETPLMPSRRPSNRPFDDLSTVRYLPAGEIVRVRSIDETGTYPWYKVRVESRGDLEGWINSTALMPRGATLLPADE